ncbi:MAG: hypothetical protein Q8O32_01425 [bacterium]|nr:hypothetical protein [bacterium]
MEEKYKINILDGFIDFDNTTNEFVELIITIDDKEIRTNKRVKETTKGFCYPPRYHKAIAVNLKKGSSLKVYIYEGEGQESINLDKPTFLRKKEGRKAIFKRASSVPYIWEKVI